MKEIKEEICCNNCRYFLQHYIKDNTVYRVIFCGHCINRNLNPQNKKKRPFNVACEFWETIEIKKAERENAIKDILRSMAQRIEEITDILKDEI